MKEYVDARELHPEYTTIPCMECDEPFYVQNSFAYNHETWYCDECKPEELKRATKAVTGHGHVTVRL